MEKDKYIMVYLKEIYINGKKWNGKGRRKY